MTQPVMVLPCDTDRLTTLGTELAISSLGTYRHEICSSVPPGNAGPQPPSEPPELRYGTPDSTKNRPRRIPLEEIVNPFFPDLEGKHVLITGGANGIGAAAAIAFAGQGCEVTLLDKDLKAGERVVDACRTLGAKACLREVDLVDCRMLRDVLDDVKREQPTVDVLVLNAGL